MSWTPLRGEQMHKKEREDDSQSRMDWDRTQTDGEPEHGSSPPKWRRQQPARAKADRREKASRDTHTRREERGTSRDTPAKKRRTAGGRRERTQGGKSERGGPYGEKRGKKGNGNVHPVKKPESRPIPSKGARFNISFIYEGILQEYSTLGFLMGGRNFPDGELVFKEREERKPALQDSTKVPPPQIDIPVSLPAAVSSHEAIRKVAAKTMRTTVNLPDCLSYQGLHEYGYHLFWLESATYCRSLESLTAHISEAISSVVGGRMFKIVYREHHDGTAYLPHQLTHAGELFDTLCTR
ncbi:hypothetical protein ACROYT_G008440 [Oculina patagonica]